MSDTNRSVTAKLPINKWSGRLNFLEKIAVSRTQPFSTVPKSPTAQRKVPSTLYDPLTGGRWGKSAGSMIPKCKPWKWSRSALGRTVFLPFLCLYCLSGSRTTGCLSWFLAACVNGREVVGAHRMCGAGVVGLTVDVNRKSASSPRTTTRISLIRWTPVSATTLEACWAWNKNKQMEDEERATCTEY